MDEPNIPPRTNKKLPANKKRDKAIMVRVDAATMRKVKREAKKDGLSLGSELLYGWLWFCKELQEQEAGD